ncbi:MAG: DUF1611 domain-containing protein [Robiginitomaculum sp.]|nr:DUF1611 domain-containing protein [Robiginitomaculum sp.]
MNISLSSKRLGFAKKAYVTRNADLSNVSKMRNDLAPSAGDLCLARIEKLGHHRRLELCSGRRSRLFVGDEILVAFGSRYATDQFHSVVPDNLDSCSLVAAGGIASSLRTRHSGTRVPTRIKPIGLLCDKDGNVLNLKKWAIQGTKPTKQVMPHLITVVGSGMNAGKTTTVSSLIRTAKKNQLDVGAIKITGTGAGGDLWFYKDSGADLALDFTDVGYSTTVGLSLDELLEIARTLYREAAQNCDIVIAELADGLYQSETAALLASAAFQEMLDSIIFATGDSMAAGAGVKHLADLGYSTAAISGAVTASELARIEAEAAAGIPALSVENFEKQEDALMISMRSAFPVLEVGNDKLAASF